MKHILIVEDDITLNKLLTNIMQTENYNVSSVYTVSEAKYCLGLNKYDLAILDINLPDGTGYEICKIIKYNSSVRNTASVCRHSFLRQGGRYRGSYDNR